MSSVVELEIHTELESYLRQNYVFDFKRDYLGKSLTNLMAKLKFLLFSNEISIKVVT